MDDGSKDSTRDEIREFASNRFDTGFIFLSRNFGKEHAMLAGIQLLALGVIGEYLGRTFIQTTNRPSYLLEEEPRPKERCRSSYVRCPRGHAQLCPRGRPWLHEFLQIHRTAQAILDAAELVQRTSIGGVGGVLVLVGGLR